MTISVLIPTYRRPDDLRRCLHALAAQTLPAHEIIVIVRDNDAPTQSLVNAWPPGILPLCVVTVAVPGVVAAMTAGLRVASGEAVALTDDDAAPFPDWLARIAAHFAADPQAGGVGGRDRIHYGDRIEEGEHPDVGRVQWFGRVIGNHHLGVGEARPVDLLKGVNCAYRTEPLRRIGFDSRLRGAGAQVHWELSLGLAMKRDGWKLIYDPAVGVEHFMAPRADADALHRGGFHAEALQNMVYNETIVLLGSLPPMRHAAFVTWALLIGTRDAPGLLQIPRLIARRTPFLRARLAATWRGRWAGLLRQ